MQHAQCVTPTPNHYTRRPCTSYARCTKADTSQQAVEGVGLESERTWMANARLPLPLPLEGGPPSAVTSGACSTLSYTYVATTLGWSRLVATMLSAPSTLLHARGPNRTLTTDTATAVPRQIPARSGRVSTTCE